MQISTAVHHIRYEYVVILLHMMFCFVMHCVGHTYIYILVAETNEPCNKLVACVMVALG